MGIQKLEPSLGGAGGGQTWSKRQLLRKWSSREPVPNKKGPCPSTPIYPTWAAEPEPVCQVEEKMGVMVSWRKEGRTVSPMGTASLGWGKPRKGWRASAWKFLPSLPHGDNGRSGREKVPAGHSSACGASAKQCPVGSRARRQVVRPDPRSPLPELSASSSPDVTQWPSPNSAPGLFVTEGI